MKTTQTLKELRLCEMTEFDHDLFCEGLVANKSLEQLTLGLDRCNVSDKIIADIISSVAGHPPAVTSFCLFVRDQFGPFSSQSLEELLASTSCLVCLKLYDRGRDEKNKLCLGQFVSGLRKNDSLKKLDVHNVFLSDESLSRLFVALAHHSTIEHLWFWEKTSRKEFEKIIAMDRGLPKPFRLYLDHKIIKDFPIHLEKMLPAHPEVRPFPFFGKKNATMERIWDLNWHGRYLLMRHNQIPLGIWAQVLEKANKNPCVVHQFLKAGILIGNEVGVIDASNPLAGRS